MADQEHGVYNILSKNLVYFSSNRTPGIISVDVTPTTSSDFLRFVSEMDITYDDFVKAATELYASTMVRLLMIEFWIKTQQKFTGVSKSIIEFVTILKDKYGLDINSADPVTKTKIALLTYTFSTLKFVHAGNKLLTTITRAEVHKVTPEEVAADMVRVEFLVKLKQQIEMVPANYKKHNNIESAALDIAEYLMRFTGFEFSGTLFESTMLSSLANAKHSFLDRTLWRTYGRVRNARDVLRIYDVMLDEWNSEQYIDSTLPTTDMVDYIAEFTAYFAQEQLAFAKYRLSLVSEVKARFELFQVKNISRSQPLFAMLNRKYTVPAVLESAAITLDNAFGGKRFRPAQELETIFRKAGLVADMAFDSVIEIYQSKIKAIPNARDLPLNFSVSAILAENESERRLLGLSYCDRVFQEQVNGPFIYEVQLDASYPREKLVDIVAAGLDRGEIYELRQADAGALSTRLLLKDPSHSVNYAALSDAVASYKIGHQTLSGLDDYKDARVFFVGSRPEYGMKYVYARDEKAKYTVSCVGQFYRADMTTVSLATTIEAHKLVLSTNHEKVKPGFLINPIIGKIIKTKFDRLAELRNFLNISFEPTDVVKTTPMSIAAADPFEMLRQHTRAEILKSYLRLAGSYDGSRRMILIILDKLGIKPEIYTDETAFIASLVNLRLAVVDMCWQMHFSLVDDLPEEMKHPPMLRELVTYVNSMQLTEYNQYRDTVTAYGGLTMYNGLLLAGDTTALV